MTQEEFQTLIEIMDEDGVYRQAHLGDLKNHPVIKEGRFPKESHFKPQADGLSVHCCRLISVDSVYHIIGLSYRPGKTDFKDPKNFKIFKLPVAFLRSIENIEKVIHDPVYHGNPAPVGSPNNRAHTSIIFQDDEEIRLKLSDYCQAEYVKAFCPIDFTLLESEITRLRERLDDTPYHRL